MSNIYTGWPIEMYCYIQTVGDKKVGKKEKKLYISKSNLKKFRKLKYQSWFPRYSIENKLVTFIYSNTEYVFSKRDISGFLFYI